MRFAEVLVGLGGGDRLSGRGGGDELFGDGDLFSDSRERGIDELFGGRGGDRLDGGPIADTLSGGLNRDAEFDEPNDNICTSIEDVQRRWLLRQLGQVAQQTSPSAHWATMRLD